jgi:hypothetical protein
LVPKDKMLRFEDLSNVEKLKQIVNFGEVEVDDLAEVIISMNRKTARNYFETQNSEGVIPSQTLKQDNTSIKLFNQEIELGNLVAELPAMKFREELNFANIVRECPDEGYIIIHLVPVSVKKAKFQYPKWKKSIDFSVI